MEVVEHSPAFFYLLKENEEDYYLDVNCAAGFISLTVLVKLSESDINGYKKQGIAYISDLAQVISQKTQRNHPGNITGQNQLKEAHESIMRWQKSNG